MKSKRTLALICIVIIISYSLGVLSHSFWINSTDYEDKNANIVFPLDQEYQQRITQVSSNADITMLNEEFSERWAKQVDEYYLAALNVANDTKKELLISDQKEWEAYTETRFEMQKAFLEAKYQGGSIVPIEMSQYELTYLRERAIYLYAIYTDLVNTALPSPG